MDQTSFFSEESNTHEEIPFPTEESPIVNRDDLNDLLEESMKFAKIILGNGPNCIAESLHCINESASHSLIDGLNMEVDSFSQLFETDETTEGLTAFVEKRKANFR